MLILQLPVQICNSPYCQLYNSYNVSSKNLVLDQLIILKFIFFFILITYLIDIVSILLEEILPWSLMGVKRLSPVHLDRFIRPFHLSWFN